jgi:hypothetical protein
MGYVKEPFSTLRFQRRASIFRTQKKKKNNSMQQYLLHPLAIPWGKVATWFTCQVPLKMESLSLTVREAVALPPRVFILRGRSRT